MVSFENQAPLYAHRAGSNDRVLRWLFRRLGLLYQPGPAEPEKELFHTVIDLVVAGAALPVVSRFIPTLLLS